MEYCDNCKHIRYMLGVFPRCEKYATKKSIGIRKKKLRKNCFAPRENREE